MEPTRADWPRDVSPLTSKRTEAAENFLRAMLGALRGWLFDPAPMHSMVLLRIGLGSILLLAYLFRWPLVDTLYGPDGVAGYSFFERFPESGPVGWPLVQAFDYLQHVQSGAVIWTLYIALLVSAACFALGVWPGATGVTALVLHSLFLSRNPAATWGWATMMKPFLLYAILASAGGQASALAWARKRLGAVVPAIVWTGPAWPLRLVQVHVACAFLALWARIDEGSWLSGQMLPVALAGREFSRLDLDWFPLFGVLQILGIAALILELGAPLALWIEPVAKYWALALMGMFLILIVATSVGWWDFMMLVALTTFLPERWLRRVTRSKPPPLAT